MPPRKPQLKIPIGIAVAALIWLPTGLVFQANAGHFGWGFLPSLLWLASLPILFLAFGALTLSERCRENKSKARFAIFAGLSAIYGIIFGIFLSLILR